MLERDNNKKTFYIYALLPRSRYTCNFIINVYLYSSRFCDRDTVRYQRNVHVNSLRS